MFLFGANKPIPKVLHLLSESQKLISQKKIANVLFMASIDILSIAKLDYDHIYKITIFAYDRNLHPFNSDQVLIIFAKIVEWLVTSGGNMLWVRISQKDSSSKLLNF